MGGGGVQHGWWASDVPWMGLGGEGMEGAWLSACARIALPL